MSGSCPRGCTDPDSNEVVWEIQLSVYPLWAESPWLSQPHYSLSLLITLQTLSQIEFSGLSGYVQPLRLAYHKLYLCTTWFQVAIYCHHLLWIISYFGMGLVSLPSISYLLQTSAYRAISPLPTFIPECGRISLPTFPDESSLRIRFGVVWFQPP